MFRLECHKGITSTSSLIGISIIYALSEIIVTTVFHFARFGMRNFLQPLLLCNFSSRISQQKLQLKEIPPYLSLCQIN